MSERQAPIMRVVIVDDNVALLEGMRECVSLAGHEVVIFSEFQAAKTHLAAVKTDVLITDIRLGAFNGLQLVLIAKLKNPKTSAIALSGFDDPVLRHDAANMGALFRLKPIGTEQLLDGIQNVAVRGNPALRVATVHPISRL
jgi:DNA-binding NtrC family response regulator